MWFQMHFNQVLFVSVVSLDLTLLLSWSCLKTTPSDPESVLCWVFMVLVYYLSLGTKCLWIGSCLLFCATARVTLKKNNLNTDFRGLILTLSISDHLFECSLPVDDFAWHGVFLKLFELLQKHCNFLPYLLHFRGSL